MRFYVCVQNKYKFTIWNYELIVFIKIYMI